MLKKKRFSASCRIVYMVLLSLSIARAGDIAPQQWVPGKGIQLRGQTLSADIPDTSKVGDLLFGLKTPLVLEPGVYRAVALVRPEPRMNMGYRIVLTVRSDKPTQSYSRWRPPHSQLTPRPKEIWHAVDEARAFQHDALGLVRLAATFAVLKTHAYQVAVGWHIGETHIGSPWLNWEQAPASLDRLTLVSLACDRLEENVLLGELRADKVVYKPGMAPVLTVPVTWTADTPKTFAYRVRMARDLEPAHTVANGTLALQPRRTVLLKVSLPKLRTFGGYRFDLDLLDGATVMQTRERSAACSPRYNRIGLSGVNHGEYFYGSTNATQQMCRFIFENMRDAYLSWLEVGFWAPDDFSNLTPRKERYISNTMAPQRRSHIEFVCEYGRRNGIGVYAYLKGNYADGRDGLAWAQRYPELVYYHRDTGRPMGQYNLDHILNWDEYEQQILARKSRIGGHWYYVRLDAGRPSIVDVSADETIASVKMFGWAGVRFDGDFSVPVPDEYYEGPVRNLKGKLTATKADAEIVYANNVLRYKKEVREALPDFEFGFNHAFDDAHQRWIVGPAIASDGSMVMNEPIRSFGHGKEQAYNRWEDFANMITRYSRIVRTWGGFYQVIGCYGMRADDYLYQTVYVLAAQAKPYGPFFFDSPFTRRLSRFVTRFAGILCADLHPVPAPEGRLTIAGSGPLDWKRYVSYLEVSRRRRDYVIQMINPPVSERARSEDHRCLLRPPVTDVRVSLDTDPFEVPVQAWLLDPWNENDADSVELGLRPGGVDLVLPRSVAIWSVLVVRCELKETR